MKGVGLTLSCQAPVSNSHFPFYYCHDLVCPDKLHLFHRHILLQTLVCGRQLRWPHRPLLHTIFIVYANYFQAFALLLPQLSSLCVGHAIADDLGDDSFLNYYLLPYFQSII